MSDNLSKGTVEVIDNSALSINDALRQLVQRIDELSGLNGRALVFDRVRVDDPTASDDALNLGAAGLGTFVLLAGTQEITGDKTLSGQTTFTGQVIISGTSVVIKDSNGTIIHSFGTIT